MGHWRLREGSAGGSGLEWSESGPLAERPLHHHADHARPADCLGFQTAVGEAAAKAVRECAGCVHCDERVPVCIWHDHVRGAACAAQNTLKPKKYIGFEAPPLTRHVNLSKNPDL